MLLGRQRDDFHARRRDGTLFPVETDLLPVRWHGRRSVVVSVSNISQRLEA